MTSTIKVNNIQNQCGANIINESANTITIGASGDTVTLASGASQSGFGRTGTVDWQTGSIKTATFTAANGEGYFCNTSGGAFTVNLPAGSAGAIVAVSDYTRTFQTNNLTISPNGSEKIGGVAANATLSTEGQTATFVYVDSTEGWINVQETSNSVKGVSFLTATGGTVTTCGNCKIHTFTGPGTFCVSTISSTEADNVVSYMVVAGGGGGGSSTGDTVAAGGGGAGGYREVKTPITPYTASPLNGYPTPGNRITVTATAYPITVGAGGAGGTNPNGAAVSGSNSIFSTITSAGGGKGANQNTNGNASGGSGGGGTWTRFAGASGNTPPTTPPQGNDGAAPGIGPSQNGGGGGGASAAGAAPTNATGGAGGAGTPSEISGSATARAGGGGGGGGFPGTNAGGAGGNGGGGAGGAVIESPAAHDGSPGTVNRGGGGGGGGGEGGNTPPYSCSSGGNGGSGIVIIRYKFQ